MPTNPHRCVAAWLATTRRLLVLVTLATAAAATGALATTYISAEPIPSPVIVGAADLAKIESIGYRPLERWSLRLAEDCRIVDDVLGALADARAISTLTWRNTRYRVAAGGFEGVTDPSYVFTIKNVGPGAASAADVFTLDNALGYVLNQGGTSQFDIPLDRANPYEFPLAYAVATFGGVLTGEHAKQFFDHLGTIDPALWTGANAGFTQIDLGDPRLDDAMLFLIGNVSTAEFTRGLFAAVRTSRGWRYAPLGPHATPTTATAGVAFPGNGWTTPSGGYLENIPDKPRLVMRLMSLRRAHLRAVNDLLRAISRNDVALYLTTRFTCPCGDR